VEAMSGLPWFRVYHRMIDDERLRLLAFEDRWHFVAVLCLKADGLLDDDHNDLWERRLALKLGIQLRELDEINRRLMNVGLIDAEWQPIKWDELQQRSDHSRDRVRRFRDKQKSLQNSDETDVTVTVTEMKRPRVDKIRQDKKEPKGSSASGDAPAFTIEDFVEAWNETAEACGLAKIRKLTESRKRAFNVRRREYPEISDWQAAFSCLRDNKWMHGDNHQGWRADPDFFLTASKFTKLVEGQYGKADRN
jgi:hypothetical protein